MHTRLTPTQRRESVPDDPAGPPPARAHLTLQRSCGSLLRTTKPATRSIPCRTNTRRGYILWAPNWSSMTVICGIDVQWPSGLIVGRGGTTAVSDLPTSDGLAGTAGRSAQSKNAKSSCFATGSPCDAARSADSDCPGPTGPCLQPWPGYCPPFVDGIASSPPPRSCAGTGSW